MTDVPQWAAEKARELAALWNDPGQEAAIARALAEAAGPKLPTMSTAFRTTVTWGGEYEMVFSFRSRDELHKAEDEWLSAVHGIEKPPAPKWRTDLENAPKDGAHILIYAGGEQFVAFWAVSIEEGDGQWVIARSPGMAFIVRNPTHWAELPAAPEVG